MTIKWDGLRDDRKGIRQLGVRGKRHLETSAAAGNIFTTVKKYYFGGTNLGLFHIGEGFKLAGGVLLQHRKQAIMENSQLFFDAIVITREAVEVRDDGVLI
jgi:hypothetical protein